MCSGSDWRVMAAAGDPGTGRLPIPSPKIGICGTPGRYRFMHAEAGFRRGFEVKIPILEFPIMRDDRSVAWEIWVTELREMGRKKLSAKFLWKTKINKGGEGGSLCGFWLRGPKWKGNYLNCCGLGAKSGGMAKSGGGEAAVGGYRFL
jgi:hypothetical protein